MKVAVLFSGGKDSVFTAFCCMQSGWETILLTVEPEEYSTMFHHPNVKWCKKQAESMGLPIKTIRAKGKGEIAELEAVRISLASLKVDGVAAGAIESEYQRERIDRIAHQLGICSFCPIWRTSRALLPEITRYFEAYIMAVSAEGLTESDLGARFDGKFLERISRFKIPISPCLEGGEGETFVANAPFFKKGLKIVKMEKKFDGMRGVAEITSLR